jgi:hypothetical protein
MRLAPNGSSSAVQRVSSASRVFPTSPLPGRLRQCHPKHHQLAVAVRLYEFTTECPTTWANCASRVSSCRCAE